MTKKCKKCNIEKDLSEFNKGKNKDGFKSFCRACDKVLNHARYNKNKDKIVKQNLEWQEKNPQKIQAYKKNFYEKHKD